MVKLTNPSGGEIKYLELSNNGSYVTALSEDNNILVWNLNQDFQLERQSLHGVAPLSSSYAVFAPNARQILTVQENEVVNFWNKELDGTWKIEDSFASPRTINQAYYLSDNNILTINLSNDATRHAASIWIKTHGGDWQEEQLPKIDDSIVRVILTRDRDKLAMVSKSGGLWVFEKDRLGFWRQNKLPLRVSQACNICLSFSKSGQLMTVRTDPRDGEVLQYLNENQSARGKNFLLHQLINLT